ncbi:TIGR04076 family protein [Breznakiella homolactica]|uniref:TIGR04076 family protein n=1 Tax=Breznakiella homolactica TaxID=2798577 RepID=A0A7T7XM79_9SPIR|nr:TIGR04076 family protein [Breznakiella homolactica]QQO08797.1 TIGR04076 family protein [Breznakiella homolactica]
MKRFEIEVETVTGCCAAGYKSGDRFYASGLNTPDGPFCGGAYMALFPMQNALHGGARFSFEKDPRSKTRLACPDNGCVVFTIRLLEEPGQ